MLRLAYLGVAAVLAAGAGGCTLHFGDDDGDDDACTDDDVRPAGEDSLEAPLPELLDPETLQCESFGGSSCDPCYESCPPVDDEPVPTWAYCYGACDSLAEADCRAVTECRAVYDYGCYTGTGPCSALVPFLGCHGVDMTGPVDGGGCVGLSAQDCSRHNDCIALHSQQCDEYGCWQQFVECRDETVETCYGAVACDALPPECPSGTVPGIVDGCWSGNCIPVEDCEPGCDDADCG